MRMKYERSRIIAETCRHHWMNRLMGLKIKKTSLMIYKKRKLLQTQAQILPCPEHQKKKKLKEILILDGENTNFDLIPTPTFLKNTDFSQKFELVPFSLLLVRENIYFYLGLLWLTFVWYNYIQQGRPSGEKYKTTHKQDWYITRNSNRRSKYKSVYSIKTNVLYVHLRLRSARSVPIRRLRTFRTGSSLEADFLIFVRGLLALFPPFFRRRSGGRLNVGSQLLTKALWTETSTLWKLDFPKCRHGTKDLLRYYRCWTLLQDLWRYPEKLQLYTRPQSSPH